MFEIKMNVNSVYALYRDGIPIANFTIELNANDAVKLEKIFNGNTLDEIMSDLRELINRYK